METPMRNQVMTISEMVYFSWHFFFKNIKDILLKALILLILPSVIFYFVLGVTDMAMGYSQGVTALEFIILLLAWILMILFGSVFWIYLYNKIQNKKTDLKKQIMETLKRLHWIILTFILYGIFQFGLFLLLIVPGFYFFYRWLFVPAAIVLKKKHGLSAFSYAGDITKKQWWTMMGYFSSLGSLIYLFVLAGMTIQLLIVYPAFTYLFSSSTETILVILVTILIAVIWICVMSFASLVFTVWFASFDHNRPKEIK